MTHAPTETLLSQEKSERKPSVKNKIQNSRKSKPKNKHTSSRRLNKYERKIIKQTVNKLINKTVAKYNAKAESGLISNNDTEQDVVESPKVEVSDILDNESNPELVSQTQIYVPDDTMSCKSNALPATYSLKSSKIKNPKKILNTKAKVFTGYTDHDNISCTESVSSEKATSLTKVYSKKRSTKIFFPKHIELPNSEVELKTGDKGKCLCHQE